jgi:lysophospholipase L1-like esterase
MRSTEEFPTMKTLLAAVRGLAETQEDLVYIDVASAMLGADGAPKPIFRDDRLHMTAEGYRIWRDRIAEAMQRHPPRSPHCPS